MERLYWEPWLRTRGSLHDAATHAGRCSSIMRHFITERQPPWHQSSLRATYSTEGLPLWDSFWRKTCFCFLRAWTSVLLFFFLCGNNKLPALSKWTLVFSKLPYIQLRSVCPGGLKRRKHAFRWDTRRSITRTDRLRCHRKNALSLFIYLLTDDLIRQTHWHYG